MKRFPDRDITVGMDTALIVGNPSVISSALLLIPAMVILAVILPGNRVMPLGDLSQFVFFIACMVPVFKKYYSYLVIISYLVWWWIIHCFMDDASNKRVIQKFGAGAQKM